MMLNIVDSELKHARELAKNLREKDKQEAIHAGWEPHKALFLSYRQGVYRKTALIDDQVAAMWGAAGSILSGKGIPYLITSDLVYQLSPIKFARIYKNEVKEMLKVFDTLENYVDSSYTEAVRMLELAGFDTSETVYLNNNKFQKFRIGL